MYIGDFMARLMGKIGPKLQGIARERPRPKKSGFMKKLLLRATAVAGLGLGAYHITEAVQTRNFQRERKHSDLVERLKGTDVKRNGFELFRIYKLDPTNKAHVQTMEVIQRMSDGLGITPARFMDTIERNRDAIEDHKFSERRMKELNLSKDGKNTKRIETIQELMRQYNFLPGYRRVLIGRMISTIGTARQVRNLADAERRGTRGK